MSKYFTYTGTDASAVWAKAQSVADSLGVPVSWLCAIVKHESGWNPAAVNGIGCVGLIQFCSEGYIKPYTLGGSGTFRSVGALAQLDYVQAYYEYWFKTVGIPINFYEFAMLGFLPAYAKKSVTTDISAYLGGNEIFDVNKDGKLYISEYNAYLYNHYGGDAELFKKVSGYSAWSDNKALTISILLISLVGIVLFKFTR